MRRLVLLTLAMAALGPAALRAQGGDPQTPPAASGEERKRILWIIPNYRTSPTLTGAQPLTPSQKWKMAADDALDPGTLALAGLFAVDGQLTASAPSFGSGASAFPKYYAAAWTDFVVGDFMTEGLYPSLLRQDPRYFRRGVGSGWTRLGYAIGQIVLTHSDAGATQFNYSEIVGNATAVAIGNAYYPDSRTLSKNLSKLTIQIGVDAAANILKEFAPDLERLVSRPHSSPTPPR